MLRARQTKTAASPEVCEFLEESSDEALIGTAVKQQEAPQLKVLSEEVSLEALEIMIEHAGELNISPVISLFYIEDQWMEPVALLLILRPQILI